jgi:ferrochelatase
MRNWTPYLSETLHRMREDGVYRALAIVMAPHRSPASWEKYREAAEAARLGLNAADAPELVYADAWHEHPLFIEAVADRVREAQAPDDAVWIFTAHSIPSEQDRVSGYSRQIRKTAELVAQKLGRSEWHLAFQSRSGNPQEEWLDPDVGDFIAELAGKGARSVLVIPVGFICDHVEVLFDLDVKARKTAEGLGVGFFRAKTVEAHPRFIELLADLVVEAVEQASE